MKRFYAVLLMALMGLLMRSALACPSAVCECKWKGGKQTVECGDAKLDNIPAGMDPGTQVLNFTGNMLRSLTTDRFAQMDLTNLQKIFLSRNKLTRIFDRAFRGLSNLVELDLSENRLTTVPTATFADYSSLMRLSLSGNAIRELRANAFRQLNFLTTLELSNNQIATIEEETFRGMDNLEWLRLDGNRIGSISGRNVLPTSLHGINLYGNAWNCDCNLMEFHRWLLTYQTPQQIDDPKCSGPERLSGRTIKWLRPAELACVPDIRPTTLHLEVAEGQNTSLRCQISAKPEATISWWFLGQLLQNDSILDPSLQLTYYVEEGVEEKSSELFLFNINAAYNGTFSCVAENVAGRSLANYTIRILIKARALTHIEPPFFLSRNFFFIIYGAGAGAFIIVLILCCLTIKCIKKSKTYKLNQKSASKMKLQNSKCSSILSDMHEPIIRANGLIDDGQQHQETRLLQRNTQHSDNQNGLLSATHQTASQESNPDVINVAKTNRRYQSVAAINDDQLFGQRSSGELQVLGKFAENGCQLAAAPVAAANARFNPLDTIPKGILKQIYHHQVDVHLNPRCFLRPANGYPAEFNQEQMMLPNLMNQQQQIAVSNQMNFYRTLPHRPKQPAAIDPKFSMEAEFLRPQTFDHFYEGGGFALPNVRYSAHHQQGYPLDHNSSVNDEHQRISIVTQHQKRVHQWPACLPGFKQQQHQSTQIVPVVTTGQYRFPMTARTTPNSDSGVLDRCDSETLNETAPLCNKDASELNDSSEHLKDEQC